MWLRAAASTSIPAPADVASDHFYYAVADSHGAVSLGRVNLEVTGVIENMSWFTGDDGRRYEIFGSGGDVFSEESCSFLHAHRPSGAVV